MKRYTVGKEIKSMQSLPMTDAGNLIKRKGERVRVHAVSKGAVSSLHNFARTTSWFIRRSKSASSADMTFR